MTWGILTWPEGSDAPKSTEAVDADYPECDYDKNVTPLYEAIEDRAWIAVNQFLHSGYWPESLFADPMPPHEQARTWVTRYETKQDGTRKVRWSQLPLHAAVIFGAPSVVIQQLVEAFPQSVRCTDDHRMLPIHLAFRHGSPDSVLALFLEEFPEAVNVRGYKGRLPVECAKKGPNPERGAIIETILKKNQSSWERKKSAVHLMELYCIKEALKIKIRKVSHLEMAMKEIKYRELKTKKELSATMESLKKMKAMKQQKVEKASDEEEREERAAVKELVEKLAALEESTKDLIIKENHTKEELKKTLVELEALKDVKPTEEQAEHFAKLEQVASQEGPNMLHRNPSEEVPSVSDEGKRALPMQEAEEETVDPRDEESACEIASKSPSMPESNMSGISKDGESPSVETAQASVPVQGSQNGQLGDPSTQETELSDSPPKSEGEVPENIPVQSIQTQVGLPEAKQADSEIKKPETVETGTNEEGKASVSGSEDENEEKDQEDKQPTEESSSSKVDDELLVSKDVSIQDDEIEVHAIERAEEGSKADAETPTVHLDEGSHGSGKKSKKKSAAKKIFSLFKRALVSKSPKKDAQPEMEPVETGKVAVPTETGELTQQDSSEQKPVELADKVVQQDIQVAEEEQAEMKSDECEEPVEESPGARPLSIDERGNSSKDEPAVETEETGSQRSCDEELSAHKQSEDGKDQQDMSSKEEASLFKKTLEEGKEFLERTFDFTLTATPVASGAEPVPAEKDRSASKDSSDESQLPNKGFFSTFDFTPAAQTPDASSKSEVVVDGKTSHVSASDKEDASVSRSKESVSVESAYQLVEEAQVEEEEEEADDAVLEVKPSRSMEIPFLTSTASRDEQKAKLAALERVNKDLEDKIKVMESHMKEYETQANVTREELSTALKALQEPESQKLSKKQEKQMAALESAMQKLEERANLTKEELLKAQEELRELKEQDRATGKPEAATKGDKEALAELAKKVATLQSAIVGFEVNEQKNFADLEQTLKEIEEVSNKRFEILSAAAEHSKVLATDSQFNKDVSKLEKKAEKEEKRLAELEAMMNELENKGSKTVEELNKAIQELEELKMKQAKQTEAPASKVEKSEKEADKRAIKELTKKVSTLQSAVVGFEVKETRTMKELEHTMRQLEELTSKRFEVLERGFSKQRGQEAGDLISDEKVGSLFTAMKDLEAIAFRTKEELETTKNELEELKKQQLFPVMSKDITKDEHTRQEKQIAELNEKIAALQGAVLGFEVKETKTLQELEQTMKQLEELTSKRFEVLQKVAGREIEAAREAEANKFGQKAARDEKKVAALEFAMRELESKAYKTRLELEKTTKALERMEQRHDSKQFAASQITKEEKRVMRELVTKVAEIQEAVMNYDEKESKTLIELEKTKRELAETKAVVEELRGLQLTSVQTRNTQNGQEVEVEESVEVAVGPGREEQGEVYAEDNAEKGVSAHADLNNSCSGKDEAVEGVEEAQGGAVTEETLNTLEQAIVQLVDRLGSSQEDDEREISEHAEDGEKAEEKHADDGVNNANAAQHPATKKGRFFGFFRSSKKDLQSKRKRKLFGVFGPRNRNNGKKEAEATSALSSKPTTDIASTAQKEKDDEVLVMKGTYNDAYEISPSPEDEKEICVDEASPVTQSNAASPIEA